MSRSATRRQAPVWLFLFALAAVAGLAELAFVVVNISSLPVFLKFGLGLPNLPGIAMATFYLAEALGNSPMGALADRYGRRRLMVVGALLSVATCLGTAHVRVPGGGGPSAWALIGAILLMRALDGLGASMLWPSVFASVGDRIPPQRQAQAMTTLNITYLVGIAIGPKVGGLLNDRLGAAYTIAQPERYAPSFYLAAGCFAVTALLAWLVAPCRRVEQAHDAAPGAVSKNALAQALHRVPWLLLLGFLIFFAVGLIAPYVKPYFMERLRLSEEQFGNLLLGPAVVLGVVSAPIGKLSDRWGKTRAIRLGMALCTAAMWGILAAPNAESIVLLGAVLGIGFVLAFPAYMAYLSDLAPEKERGGMIGAVRMAQGVGALTGSALSSPLYTLDSEHRTVFCLSAGLLTVGLLLSLLVVRERPAGGGGRDVTEEKGTDL